MSQPLIEAIGYAGSLLVLVSLLMTSVVKLRVLNTIGSAVFCAYAIIIHSWPTAVMNFCLVLINLHFLWKMSRKEKVCELVRLEPDDRFLQHLLACYGEDIRACFPGADLSVRADDRVYLVLCDGMPAGLNIGTESDGVYEMRLDYSTPRYRDCSIGRFLLTALPKEGVRALSWEGDPANHRAYLTQMGFTEQPDGRWLRPLG